MGRIELMAKDFVFTYHFWIRNMTAVTVTIIVAMQAAKLAEPPVSPTNSEYTNVGITLYPSPISAGVPKSAIQFINTRRAAATSVGVTRGMITVNTFFIPPQPRLSAASERATSIFFRAPETYM